MISRVIKKMSNKQKIIYSLIIVFFTLLIVVGIPSLAKYKNNNSLINTTAWDGSIATSYSAGTGVEFDPYIISNGAELAYFSEELKSNNYLNTYFKISNDIKLNEGRLIYDETDGIKYILNDITYYVDFYTKNYYDNVDKTGNIIGTVNLFNSLNNFKGVLDGNYHTINGLYITSETKNELGLFTNLNGSISNLYVTDALIYGGIYTGGISSTATDSTIKNTLFDGYVIGRNTSLNNNLNVAVDIPAITSFNTSNIDIINNNPLYSSVINSTTITGNCEIIGDAIVKINNNIITNGTFNIDLGTTLLDNITITTLKNTEDSVSVTFINVTYNISYNYSVSAGIVANSKNTIIKNTINKGTINSEYVAGGIIGITNDLNTISNTYNNGIINGNSISGGIIGVIEKNSNTSTLEKSYNTSNIEKTNSGGLIGAVIDTTNLSISNVFDDSITSKVIYLENNSNLIISNAYYTNTSGIGNNSNFIITTSNNLKNKDFLTTNLSLNEFISLEDLENNNDNAWTFINNEYPILFIDDIMTINIDSYSWNSLKYVLENYQIDNSITFDIRSLSGLNTEKQIYYYLNTSTVPLSTDELSNITSWTEYNNAVQIGLTGQYIIYAKIVDDTDITYINTDLITLDLTGPTININVNDNTWNTYSNNPSNVYLDRGTSATISAIDLYNEVDEIKYYITNNIIDIATINLNNFISYTEPLVIDTKGNTIIYVRSTDTKGNVSYANSSMLVYDGYSIKNLEIGMDPPSYNETSYNITDKSIVSINTNYSNSGNNLSNITHNLISNILLPVNTAITVIDNVNTKVYKFIIPTSEDIYGYNSSCEELNISCKRLATYPFTLFKEVGTNNADKYFVESDYNTNNSINEDFTILLDFSNTNILDNYLSASLYLELHDSTGLTIRPTLYSEIKSFNLLKNSDNSNTYATLNLSTDTELQTINLNNNSTTNINITSKLIYKTYYLNNIIDTKYENENMGLLVKLVDSSGNTINKDYIKNIRFKIDSNEYYPTSDNLIRINLNNGINDTTKVLSIIVDEDNTTLPSGNYYFKISNYVSYDGEYYDNLGNDEITIPAVIENNNYKNKYSFDVFIEDENRILSKTNPSTNIKLNIIEKDLNNPNIRVSLYQKDNFTAYDQNYSLVDLQNYVTNTLNSSLNKEYNIFTNMVQYDGTSNTYNYFELNLDMNKFNYGGYRLVFDLYDGNKKVETIDKNFIVK